MLGDFVAVLDQAGNEQVFGIGVAQNHAGSLRSRNDARIIVALLVGGLRRLPEFAFGLVGNFRSGAPDDVVRIIFCAAASGSRIHFWAETAAARAKNAGDGKDCAVVTVGGNLFVVTIGDRTCRIDEAGADDGTYNFHFFGVAGTDAVGQPDRNRKL